MTTPGRAIETRCGFVSLAGEPNVGKSTLLNRLIGEDLAIISPKPQTTWQVVRGILTTDTGQIIFIDTPGIHRSRRSPPTHLGRRWLAGPASRAEIHAP